jgi:hypothetical protein
MIGPLTEEEVKEISVALLSIVFSVDKKDQTIAQKMCDDFDRLCQWAEQQPKLQMEYSLPE